MWVIMVYSCACECMNLLLLVVVNAKINKSMPGMFTAAEFGIGTLRMSLEIHKKYLESIRTGVGRPQ